MENQGPLQFAFDNLSRSAGNSTQSYSAGIALPEIHPFVFYRLFPLPPYVQTLPSALHRELSCHCGREVFWSANPNSPLSTCIALSRLLWKTTIFFYPIWHLYTRSYIFDFLILTVIVPWTCMSTVCTNESMSYSNRTNLQGEHRTEAWGGKNRTTSPGRKHLLPVFTITFICWFKWKILGSFFWISVSVKSQEGSCFFKNTGFPKRLKLWQRFLRVVIIWPES